MPQLGEIRKGWEIGKKWGSGYDSYIWHACEICGKERWVCIRHNKPRNLRCIQCETRIAPPPMPREHNPRWKGGYFYHKGYVFILQPDHPKATENGYVKRARLVLEEKLGRYLLPGMFPHHENEIKDDDSPGNLEEVTRSRHVRLHRGASI